MAGARYAATRVLFELLWASQLPALARRISRCKGVIFTLHRVLPEAPADFSPNAILQVTPDYLQFVIERVRDWVGNGARVLVRRALAGGLQHEHIDDARAEQALELFMQLYATSHGLTRVYPGVREALDWLREQKVELAIVTNKPERFVAPLLDEKGLGGYFRWIIGGDTLPQQKPDPAALRHVLQLARIEAGQALFIGDSRSDVLAAKAAGVACVALTYGYNHGRPIAEENPARVLDNLRELLPAAALGG